MQYMERSSRATHGALITCNMRDSAAIKFDRAEITFISALPYWLKLLANEGGEETVVPRERKPLMMSFRTCHTQKPENSNPQPRLEPAL